jgi:hypothetical protein
MHLAEERAQVLIAHRIHSVVADVYHVQRRRRAAAPHPVPGYALVIRDAAGWFTAAYRRRRGGMSARTGAAQVPFR